MERIAGRVLAVQITKKSLYKHESGTASLASYSWRKLSHDSGAKRIFKILGILNET